MAKDNLKRLFYSNWTTFSLEKYVINMKQTFNVPGNYNVLLYEEYRERKLLGDTYLPNNNLKTDFNTCRYIHSASFETSPTHTPIVISHLFPATQPQSWRHEWRRQVNSYGRVGIYGRDSRFKSRGGHVRESPGGRVKRGKVNRRKFIGICAQ